MTTPSPYTRLLDWIERLLWQSQDDRLRAEGWEVTRVGRWRRRYRHPRRAARLTRTARPGGDAEVVPLPRPSHPSELVRSAS